MRRKPPDPEPLLAKLNDRQRAFVKAWLKTNHATRAAREAAYAWPDKQGSRLLSRPDVKAVLDAYLEQCKWELEVEMKKEVARRAAEVAKLVRQKRRKASRALTDLTTEKGP